VVDLDAGKNIAAGGAYPEIKPANLAPPRNALTLRPQSCLCAVPKPFPGEGSMTGSARPPLKS